MIQYRLGWLYLVQLFMFIIYNLYRVVEPILKLFFWTLKLRILRYYKMKLAVIQKLRAMRSAKKEDTNTPDQAVAVVPLSPK